MTPGTLALAAKTRGGARYLADKRRSSTPSAWPASLIAVLDWPADSAARRYLVCELVEMIEHVADDPLAIVDAIAGWDPIHFADDLGATRVEPLRAFLDEAARVAARFVAPHAPIAPEAIAARLRCDGIKRRSQVDLTALAEPLSRLHAAARARITALPIDHRIRALAARGPGGIVLTLALSPRRERCLDGIDPKSSAASAVEAVVGPDHSIVVLDGEDTDHIVGTSFGLAAEICARAAAGGYVRRNLAATGDRLTPPEGDLRLRTKLAAIEEFNTLRATPIKILALVSEHEDAAHAREMGLDIVRVSADSDFAHVVAQDDRVAALRADLAAPVVLARGRKPGRIPANQAIRRFETDNTFAMLLVGEPGTGKTTLRTELVQQWNGDPACRRIAQPVIDEQSIGDALAVLAARLGCTLEPARIAARLANLAAHVDHVIWIVDADAREHDDLDRLVEDLAQLERTLAALELVRLPVRALVTLRPDRAKQIRARVSQLGWDEQPLELDAIDVTELAREHDVTISDDMAEIARWGIAWRRDDSTGKVAIASHASPLALAASHHRARYRQFPEPLAAAITTMARAARSTFELAPEIAAQLAATKVVQSVAGESYAFRDEPMAEWWLAEVIAERELDSSQALAWLRTATKDGNAELLRRAFVLALVRAPKRAVFGALLASGERDAIYVVSRAIAGLERWRPRQHAELWGLLYSALARANPATWVTALGGVGDQRDAAPVLARALHHRDAEVRAAARVQLRQRVERIDVDRKTTVDVALAPFHEQANRLHVGTPWILGALVIAGVIASSWKVFTALGVLEGIGWLVVLGASLWLSIPRLVPRLLAPFRDLSESALIVVTQAARSSEPGRYRDCLDRILAKFRDVRRAKKVPVFAYATTLHGLAETAADRIHRNVRSHNPYREPRDFRAFFRVSADVRGLLAPFTVMIGEPIQLDRDVTDSIAALERATRQVHAQPELAHAVTNTIVEGGWAVLPPGRQLASVIAALTRLYHEAIARDALTFAQSMIYAQWRALWQALERATRRSDRDGDLVLAIERLHADYQALVAAWHTRTEGGVYYMAAGTRMCIQHLFRSAALAIAIGRALGESQSHQRGRAERVFAPAFDNGLPAKLVLDEALHLGHEFHEWRAAEHVVAMLVRRAVNRDVLQRELRPTLADLRRRAPDIARRWSTLLSAADPIELGDADNENPMLGITLAFEEATYLLLQRENGFRAGYAAWLDHAITMPAIRLHIPLLREGRIRWIREALELARDAMFGSAQ